MRKLVSKLTAQQALRGAARFHHSGPVRSDLPVNPFGERYAFEVYFTPQNKVFVIDTGLDPDLAIFPSLQGAGVLRFDDPAYDMKRISDEFRAWLVGVLSKQRKIRAEWPTPDEDEEAFRYS